MKTEGRTGMKYNIREIAKNVHDYIGWEYDESVESIMNRITTDPVGVLKQVMDLAREDWEEEWN